MRSLHRTSIVESILIVLDDCRNGMERITAVGVLHSVLKIKVLNRDMIVAAFEIAAHRFEVGLFHLLAHAFFVAEISFYGRYSRIEQSLGVAGRRALERRRGIVVRSLCCDDFLLDG